MTLTMDRETDDEAEPTDDPEAEEYGHLDDLADGAGCTEIWEHLSDSREE
ncbi:hypothetical protein [Halobellus limi]|jgi:hypothetical protein|uniref:Uncharacterized protein n=1 Tax=Halobellus limi TaxID=699433 RepID=A0A1H6CN03_9EURY|nr:hypothetical protein [Halobellus limi]SEG74127.1 hypothetical protein SAMN04488133_3561 [Halobellus limi]